MNLRSLNALILCISIVIYIFSTVQNSYSESFENQQKALDMIVDFANGICGNEVAHEGSNESLELTGNAKIELNKLLRNVVDLGAEGAVKYQDLEYKGVLQKDLALLLQSGAECKKEVANSLIDKLVMDVTPESSGDASSIDTVVGSSYEVRCTDDKEGNIFDSIIQIKSEEKANWRYTNATEWQSTLKVDQLSAHRLLLTSSNLDERHATWNLEFSEDFENVTGWYKFLQRDQSNTRWREYVVKGSIIK